MMKNSARPAHLGGPRFAYARRAFCTGLLFAMVIAVAQPAAASGDADPAAFAFIQGLGNDAIKGLTNPAIPRPEREARFRRLLNDHFDMAAMSKFVLGRYYRSTDATQRAEFQRLFEDFIVASYAERFSDYMGEGLRVAGSSAEDGGTILVHSKIDMPASEDIHVDWLLRRANENFAIVDIIVEGVSMDVTHRSEFASVIQDHGGVNGLIEALRTKSLQSAANSTQQ
jgi:phospholipid transport system substrate-binding protein